MQFNRLFLSVSHGLAIADVITLPLGSKHSRMFKVELFRLNNLLHKVNGTGSTEQLHWIFFPVVACCDSSHMSWIRANWMMAWLFGTAQFIQNRLGVAIEAKDVHLIS